MTMRPAGIITCLVFFVFVTTPSAAQTSTQTSSFELRGKVLDATTREPIRKALVSIVGDRNREAVTSDDGRFSLVLAAPGAVELYVSTVGYGLLKREILVPNDAAFELEVLIAQAPAKR